MAITHGDPTRDILCDACVDQLDVGGPGNLLILDVGTTLATLPLPAQAFGTAGSGTATANAVTTQNATQAGTANLFEARNNAGTVVFQGTVTESGGGGDLIITNANINIGDPISVVTWTYSSAL